MELSMSSKKDKFNNSSMVTKSLFVFVQLPNLAQSPPIPNQQNSNSARDWAKK